VRGEPIVHPTAVPNGLPVERLHRRPEADGTVVVDPGTAGWRYLGFRTVELEAGQSISFGSAGHEACVVVIGGGGVLVRPVDAEPIELVGRDSPFDALPWAAYLPSGASGSAGKAVRSSAEGQPSRPGGHVRIAVAEAPRVRLTGVAKAPITIRPADIAVETRGAGHSTRQINHIVAPGFRADRLLLVEVLTPAGNWSSWPPHKHDVDDMPNEAVLEEIYYYAFGRPEAWAIQRLYRPPGGPLGEARDGVWAVRDGDVVLVTDGYHPFASTDADDAYYLNALAGDRRTMACSFDPALDQVRERWATEPPDPRVPLVRARD
jgi:5-deoxy-glucuronate isomerase